MTATLPEDCPQGLAAAPLAAVRDDRSAPQAPQALPVGTPALVFASGAPPRSRLADRRLPLDRRPLDTTLRI
jgi:hypothetical protein